MRVEIRDFKRYFYAYLNHLIKYSNTLNEYHYRKIKNNKLTVKFL